MNILISSPSDLVSSTQVEALFPRSCSVQRRQKAGEPFFNIDQATVSQWSVSPLQKAE